MVQLIDFYAEWCGPCKQQTPIVDELGEDIDGLEIEKVDVDENQERANEYNVRSLPTLVILDNNGDIAEQFIGLTQREDLEDAVNSVL